MQTKNWMKNYLQNSGRTNFTKMIWVSVMDDTLDIPSL